MNRVQKFVVLLGLILASLNIAYAKDSIVSLAVTVESEVEPVEITVNIENFGEPVTLKKDPAATTYCCTLPLDTYLKQANMTRPMVPYRLVGDWEDFKEQLFLKSKPGLSKPVCLRMYHYTYSKETATFNELSEIDALGSDYYSVLEKYFKSRAYHYYWRHKAKLPEHSSALRSAKIWYDTAFKLASMKDTVFRRDQDIIKIANEYERKKKKNPTLKRRWEKYAREGYIANMNLQLAAMEYRFVGDIPDLVKKGKVKEAERLNVAALKALEKEHKAVIKAVAKYQGINRIMLEDNAKHFSSMKHSPGLR